MESKTEFAPLLARIHMWMGALAVVGLTGFGVKDGLRGLLGFALGASASALSFWLLERMTGGLERGGISRVRALLLGLRFLIIGAILYAILRLHEVSVSAIAAGLLLSVTAVTLANLYDWFRS